MTIPGERLFAVYEFSNASCLYSFMLLNIQVIPAVSAILI